MAYRTIAELKENVPPEAVNVKRVANNTLYYELPNGARCWNLHDTRIVEIVDGYIILNSGGYQTQTTKERLNRYVPDGWYLYQEKSQWYLRIAGDTIPYYDGITLPLTGEVSEVSAKNAEQEAKKTKKLLKLINRYCNAVQELIDNDELPKPSPGDCWLCHFEKPTCILSHLEEVYVHGTLIVNAYRWAGYRDNQLPYIWGFWNTKILSGVT
jgi:hypothetical protein